MKVELDSLWDAKKVSYSNPQLITKRENRVFTNYQNVVSSGKNIIAVKSGYSDIPQFISIDSLGSEKKVFTPGIFDNYHISANSQCIVWAEHKKDPRWTFRDYSVVMKYDIQSKKKKQLTKKTRYFAPSISPNGNQICAIEINLENQNSLVLLDPNSGQVTKRFSNPQNFFYKTPRWNEDGSKIISVKLTKKGYQLVSIDAKNETETLLMKPWRTIISQPIFYQNYVLFHSGYNGRDNIYAVDITSKAIWQITQAKNGAFSPAVSNDILYFSNYKAEGYDIAKLPLDPNNWVPFSKIVNESIDYYKPVVEQEYGSSITDSIPEKTYPVKKYKKIPHSFNPHSWGPIIPDANDQSAGIGFYFASQDVLSTTTASASATLLPSPASHPLPRSAPRAARGGPVASPAQPAGAARPARRAAPGTSNWPPRPPA